MRLPGVATVVDGVTGAALQVLRAGVQGAAGAAGAVQLLTGPVVESVNQSTGRLLGAGNSRDGAAPPVRWHSGRRVHLDLDPLLPFPRWHEHAAAVEQPVRGIAGVASAHVEGALGRLVIELEDGADSDLTVQAVRAAACAAAADVISAAPPPAPRTAPFADP
ncbi:MAG: cation-translocating P-type ATPase, partial [Mycobacterium sp.]